MTGFPRIPTQNLNICYQNRTVLQTQNKTKQNTKTCVWIRLFEPTAGKFTHIFVTTNNNNGNNDIFHGTQGPLDL